MKPKGSKTIISVFFSIRLWLEFLLLLCQFAALSIRVLYWDIVHNTIVYLPPFWCGQQGISIVGASYRKKDAGSSLGIPQSDVHKISIYHKQQIFSHRIEGAVSLKYLPLNIGPDIDLVCQPAASSLTSW